MPLMLFSRFSSVSAMSASVAMRFDFDSPTWSEALFWPVLKIAAWLSPSREIKLPGPPPGSL